LLLRSSVFFCGPPICSLSGKVVLPIHSPPPLLSQVFPLPPHQYGRPLPPSSSYCYIILKSRSCLRLRRLNIFSRDRYSHGLSSLCFLPAELVSRLIESESWRTLQRLPEAPFPPLFLQLDTLSFLCTILFFYCVSCCYSYISSAFS